jgi:cytochrome c556
MTTEDSTVPGIERPENIQTAIDQDPESFERAALRLRDAGLSALAAIENQNPQGLVEAGGDLDAACEACHLKYWYPHSPRPN